MNRNAVFPAIVIIFLSEQPVRDNMLNLIQTAVCHKRKLAEFGVVGKQIACPAVLDHRLFDCVFLGGGICQAVFNGHACGSHEGLGYIEGTQISRNLAAYKRKGIPVEDSRQGDDLEIGIRNRADINLQAVCDDGAV